MPLRRGSAHEDLARDAALDLDDLVRRADDDREHGRRSTRSRESRTCRRVVHPTRVGATTSRTPMARPSVNQRAARVVDAEQNAHRHAWLNHPTAQALAATGSIAAPARLLSRTDPGRRSRSPLGCGGEVHPTARPGRSSQNIPIWDISRESVHGTGAEVKLRAQNRPLQTSVEEDAHCRGLDPGPSRGTPEPAPVVRRQVRGRRETPGRRRVHGGGGGHRLRSRGVHRTIGRVRGRADRPRDAMPRHRPAEEPDGPAPAPGGGASAAPRTSTEAGGTGGPPNGGAGTADANVDRGGAESTQCVADDPWRRCRAGAWPVYPVV